MNFQLNTVFFTLGGNVVVSSYANIFILYQTIINLLIFYNYIRL
jgi:hypothetical protein